jgi:hypothetical protein
MTNLLPVRVALIDVGTQTDRRASSFATTVSQLKMYDFSGDTFKGFEAL